VLLTVGFKMDWHTLDHKAVLAKLHTSAAGLTAAEVAHRQLQYGQNILPSGKIVPWWRMLLNQVNSPLVYVLLVAAVVSGVVGEKVDVVVILTAVLIQVVVGVVQEYKAQTALVALQNVIALSAQVVRDGVTQVIPATALVPGDSIILSTGEKVPADVRLFTTTNLALNEAVLTGESDAAIKSAHTTVLADASIGDRVNMAFSGTVVTQGSATGIVVAIGQHAEVGKIADLIATAVEVDTPLQIALQKLAKIISIIVVIIAIALFGFGYAIGGDPIEMFTVAVAVAVSAIPEGLTIAVTIILAVGMKRILQRKGLVRKLVAAETLGSTDVICTDKTGTLTTGKMQVTDVVTWESDFAVDGSNRTQDQAARDLVFALRLGILCNDAVVNNPTDMIDDWVISGNLTERALVLAGIEVGIDYQQLHKFAPRLDHVPFNSTIKYMATLHREPHGHMVYMKGAPEVVLSHCTTVMVGRKTETFTEAKREQFEKKFLQLSKRGLRIIALAYKHTAHAKTVAEAGLDELIFVGYVGIKDPLRPEAKVTVAACLQAGIRTVMITGDHKLTAKAIAEDVGLDVSRPGSIMEGKELDQLTQYDLDQCVKNVVVFARVTPEHKIRIVRAWQKNNCVVAMTGDGINDAPAIKAADIGVALGSGTDVAKDTADLVILDDNFSTILAAVEEGRGIFDNIKKTTLYLVSDSLTEVILVVSSLLLGFPVPVTAAMILWINIVGDSFPSLAMTQEPKEPLNMLEAPRGRKTGILDTEVITLTVIISCITAAFNLALFIVLYKYTGQLEYARTVVFLSIGIDSLFFMFSIRSLRTLLYRTNLFSNPWLVCALVAGILLQALPIYVPVLQGYFGTVTIDYKDWGLVLGIIFVEIICIEICKYFFLVKGKHKKVDRIHRV